MSDDLRVYPPSSVAGLDAIRNRVVPEVREDEDEQDDA